MIVRDASMRCTLHEAVNFGQRLKGTSIDCLILHYTGMKSGQGAIDWLCAEESGVSCHYLVEENGTIHQMVREIDRAWHAGKSCWHGETDINSCSIGIEIVNPGHEHGYVPFPDRQIEAVIALGNDICRRRSIRPERVLAHSDVAPGRKQDPGELFPWEKLHAAGLGLWVRPAALTGGEILFPGGNGEAVAALQAMLSLYGYCVPLSGNYCDQTRIVVEAFQRHFRPEKVDGNADSSTISTLETLLGQL